MDQQQQTQQTEKIIVEMLEFLDSSSEEDNEVDKLLTTDVSIIEKDFNDNILIENLKPKNDLKKVKKPTSAIAKELKKLKKQYPIWNTKEIAGNNNKSPVIHDVIHCKTSSGICDKSNVQAVDDGPACDYAHSDWHNKLETNCRRSSSNAYIQEIHKAIYQDTTGHPPSGSAEYYQAAQNYVLYGKHFFDFPENLQTVMNDKNAQSTGADNWQANCFYQKPNTATPIAIAPPTSAAATYYQICNSMQAQARPALSNNPGNSTAYGIFLGNKVTYVAASPTNPSLIYNQHSTTTTNFISNSLANAALATSPTILYTNPMLTTTTQQYLNTFFKETQFLSTALMANSTQSATVASNANGAGIYERLIYAQMLQQQLYQTQQAAAVAAMFQHKQRAAAAAATIAAVARQTGGAINANSNRTSPQQLTAVPSTSSCNGSILNTCTRQAARSSSPSDLLQLKQQKSSPISATIGNAESCKATND